MTIQENNNAKKKSFVVHNLQNFYKKDEVEDYIENTLKKLYNDYIMLSLKKYKCMTKIMKLLDLINII